MSGTTRSSADLEPRRRALLFRAWHRGMREMDLIMGPFVDTYIGELSAQDVTDLELLVDVPDRDIFDWLTGASELPEEFNTPLFAKLKTFQREGLAIIPGLK